jgi:hypothetical protein
MQFGCHFPSYIIPGYIHSHSYATVDVADAARTADRSLLTDPPTSNVIAAICLTAKKGLASTRDYRGPCFGWSTLLYSFHPALHGRLFLV